MQHDASTSKETYGAGGKYAANELGHELGPAFVASALDQVEQIRTVRSADELLEWGIGDLTFIQGDGGLLGRGKFSTVYKVQDAEGKEHALKHTPLWPHHPLIATRLLREPELLGQLPPHPNLVGVEGWIKTRSHFYLVETFSKDHVPLSEIQLPLSWEMAKSILDQLVSVVRDGLHKAAKVVHRDLKAENVLCNSDGHIVLLDLGLATHFSTSSPRLTTCCGSPAFHSPEIVNALSHPPGEIRYYGPELDIWCIGLTILTLLLGRKYPIGTSHKDIGLMKYSVQLCLHEVDQLYPPLSVEGQPEDVDDWIQFRRALEGFLTIDGVQRMRNFEGYQLGPQMNRSLSVFAKSAGSRTFKSIFFHPTEIKYTLPLHLKAVPESSETTAVTLYNHERLPAKKVLSYLKYLLRSDGILYHHVPYESPRHEAILQCVLSLPPDSPLIQVPRPQDVKQPSFLDSIFGRRSMSVPPIARPEHGKRSAPPPPPPSKMEHCLRFYLVIDCGANSQANVPPGESQLQHNGSLKPFSRPERPNLPRALSSDHARRVTSDPSDRVTSTTSTGDGPSSAGPRPLRTPLVRSRSTPRVLSRRHPSETIKLRVSDARAMPAVLHALEPCRTAPITMEKTSATLKTYDADEHEQATSSLEEMRSAEEARARGRQRSGTSPEERSKAESARPGRPSLQVTATEEVALGTRDTSIAAAVRQRMVRQVSDYVGGKEHPGTRVYIQEDKPYDEGLIGRLKGSLMLRH